MSDNLCYQLWLWMEWRIVLDCQSCVLSTAFKKNCVGTHAKDVPGAFPELWNPASLNSRGGKVKAGSCKSWMCTWIGDRDPGKCVKPREWIRRPKTSEQRTWELCIELVNKYIGGSGIPKTYLAMRFFSGDARYLTRARWLFWLPM